MKAILYGTAYCRRKKHAEAGYGESLTAVLTSYMHQQKKLTEDPRK
ncbi:hypothetical protein SATMO3_39720 [Sporomusa aerivorans]